MVRNGAWASQSDWHERCSKPDLLSQPSSDREPKVLQSELMVLDQCQVNANKCQAPSKVPAWEINLPASSQSQLLGLSQKQQ